MDEEVAAQHSAMEAHGDAYAEATMHLAMALREMRRTRGYLYAYQDYASYLAQRHPTLKADHAQRLVIAVEHLGHDELRRWIGRLGLHGCYWLANIKQLDAQRFEEIAAAMQSNSAAHMDGDMQSLQQVASELRERIRSSPREKPSVRANLPIPRRKRAVGGREPVDSGDYAANAAQEHGEGQMGVVPMTKTDATNRLGLIKSEANTSTPSIDVAALVGSCSIDEFVVIITAAVDRMEQAADVTEPDRGWVEQLRQPLSRLYHVGMRLSVFVRNKLLKNTMNKLLLRKHYLDRGMTIREIADALGVSVRAVREALHTQNIPLRQRGPRRDIAAAFVSEELRRQIEADVAAFGIGEAAKRNNLSPEVLHALRGRQPLPRGTRPKADDRWVRATYEARRQAGEPAMRIVADLAARFACSEATIRRSLRRTCAIEEQQGNDVFGSVRDQMCASADDTALAHH